MRATTTKQNKCMRACERVNWVLVGENVFDAVPNSSCRFKDRPKSMFVQLNNSVRVLYKCATRKPNKNNNNSAKKKFVYMCVCHKNSHSTKYMRHKSVTPSCVLCTKTNSFVENTMDGGEKMKSIYRSEYLMTQSDGTVSNLSIQFCDHQIVIFREKLQNYVIYCCTFTFADHVYPWKSAFKWKPKSFNVR